MTLYDANETPPFIFNTNFVFIVIDRAGLGANALSVPTHAQTPARSPTLSTVFCARPALVSVFGTVGKLTVMVAEL